MLRLIIFLILSVLFLSSISCSTADRYAKKHGKVKSDEHQRHIKTTRLHSTGMPVKVVKKK